MPNFKKYNITSSWIFKYTCLFAIACLLTFWTLVYHGKSFIGFDGYYQLYDFLMYYGKYLRGIVSGVFFEHNFYVPSFDLSIGLGGNVFEVLHYYGLGDVLNLLAVFCPEGKTEILYTFLVFIRIYLAGVFFILFCFHHGHAETRNVLLGVIVYAFSYWTISVASLHPYFLNPLIYFPLILLGIDFILEKNNPVLFILSCTLALYASVYFFYMMTILAVIYAVSRYIFIYSRTEGIRHFLVKFGIAALGYFVAITLAIPVFLPFARSVLSGGRIGNAVPLLYEPLYYLKLPVAFINAASDHWAVMGYTVIALVALLFLFKTRIQDSLELKIYTLLCILFVLFPIFGSVFNGFGYASNRWIWGFNLLGTFIIVTQLDKIFSLEKKYLLLIGFSAFIFALPTFLVRSHGNKSYMQIALIFAACLAVFIIFLFFCKKQNTIIFVIVFLSIFLSAYSHYSPAFFNYVAQTKDMSVSYTGKMNSQFKVYEDNAIDLERKYRIDVVSPKVCSFSSFGDYEPNSAMLFNRYSTCLYYSTNDSFTRKLFKDTGLAVNSDLFYTGLNERAFLDAFLGCRYISVKTTEKDFLPFGYTKELFSNENISIYETSKVLPLVFTYDSYLSMANYNSLASFQKQQALLQTAALNFVPESSELKLKDISDIELSDKAVEYSVQDSSPDLGISENIFTANKSGVSVDIILNNKCSDGEYYFVFKGLDYSNGIKKSVNLGYLSLSLLDSSENRTLLTKQFELREKSDQMYSNLHDFIYNIGYIESPPEEMTFRITFNKPGNYSFDKLSVVCQPVDKIAAYVEKLTQDAIDYHYENGRMYISCTLEAEKILCISAPYQSGSYALVDGKKQKCFCVNNFATGILVPQGEHEIKVFF